MKLPCIIVDLDGTLSDCRWRVHHAHAKDWDEFHKGVEFDEPVSHVLLAVRQFAILYDVVISTGRPEELRPKTLKWMSEHRVPCKALYMRSAEDFRSVSRVKRDHLLAIKQKWDPWLVLEDTSSVVKMFREEGLTVFQVAEEAFP